MKANTKLAYAIAAVLGSSALGLGLHAHAATAADAAAEDEGIAEITVTAQRRVESAQNVPITIQTIGTEQLKEMNISNFDDAVRQLPNVSFAENGPGQGNIFMRGLSPGSAGNQSQSSIASFPNVAVYLDDQSLQFPGRNLDILAIDMERIEILEGPQGTLFGGGAQAGAVRYITNKPVIDKTEVYAEASYGVTAGGDPNSGGNLSINLPVIPDLMAIRAVVYTDHRGGYIDNVPGTLTRANTDGGAYTFNLPAVGGVCANGQPTTGFCVPAGLPVTNNLNVVKDNQNPVDYNGLRVSALIKINEDWNVLLQQSYQNMEADGVFYQLPTGSDGGALAPLQTQVYTPSYDKDKFENSAWTLNGKIGPIGLVYTGAYLVRTTTQTQDYTNYARGDYGSYYQCSGYKGDAAKTGTPTCYSAATNWQDYTKNTHQTHELRATGSPDWFVRPTVGAFWEDFEIKDNMNFNYKTVPGCDAANLATAAAGGPACLSDVNPIAGATTSFPYVRGDTTAFGEDLQRGFKQTAFFASADIDILPKVLTLSAGTRYYTYSEFETGSEYSTGPACLDIPNGCNHGKNLNAYGLDKTYNGFRSRGNLTWHITPDTLLYYTYSQGFRPGGFNRESGTSAVAKGADGVDQLLKPSGYSPDTLTNHEVGFKSEWLDRHLIVNVSAYHMLWANVQTPLFNPSALGNTTFVTNGANYRVNGAELQATAKVYTGVTLNSSISYNDAKQSNNPCLTNNNPASAGFGGCISQVVAPSGVLTPLLSVFGPQGGQLAFSPKIQGNFHARYDAQIFDYKTFVQAGVAYTGGMYNQLDNGTTNYVGPVFTTLLRYYQPQYYTYDAQMGVSKDNWTCEFFGQNLANSHASVFTSSAQFIESQVPVRPRVLGVKVSYKF